MLFRSVDGLLHVSDFSWTEKLEHPSDRVSEGDEVTVKILSVDEDNRKISLGLKQLSDDPVEQYFSENPPKSIIEGTVKELLADGGCILTLADKVEGFVPAKHLGKGVEVGESVSAKVLEFHARDKKIQLSIKQAQKDLERSAFEEYNKSNDLRSEQESANDMGALASLKAEIEQEERDRSETKANKAAKAEEKAKKATTKASKSTTKKASAAKAKDAAVEAETEESEEASSTAE